MNAQFKPLCTVDFQDTLRTELPIIGKRGCLAFVQKNIIYKDINMKCQNIHNTLFSILSESSNYMKQSQGIKSNSLKGLVLYGRSWGITELRAPYVEI